MKKIKFSEDVTSLSDFRANTASYIKKITEERRPLVITQNGKSKIIVLDVYDYEALLEKIDSLKSVLMERHGVGKT